MNAEFLCSGPQLAASHSMYVNLDAPVLLNDHPNNAGFALYKALVKRARAVPLPDHVAYRPADPAAPYVHPIHRFVRHQFQQNRADTSHRLVVAALNVGYKFVELLDAARMPDSPSHKQIVSYLEKRGPPKKPPKPLRAKAKRLEKERKKQERRTMRAAGIPVEGERQHPPVIVRRPIPGSERVSHDGILTHIYEYVPGSPPRPLSEIPGGVRRVPVLTADATGIPFLRMGKPQSPILSRAIRLKSKKRRNRAQVASVLMRDELPFASQEDTWDHNLVRAIQESEEANPGSLSESTEALLDDIASEPSYRSSVAVAIATLNSQLNVETADMLARAKAYLQIVDRERDLAEQEEKERQAKKQQEESK